MLQTCNVNKINVHLEFSFTESGPGKCLWILQICCHTENLSSRCEDVFLASIQNIHTPIQQVTPYKKFLYNKIITPCKNFPYNKITTPYSEHTHSHEHHFVANETGKPPTTTPLLLLQGGGKRNNITVL